MRGSLAVALLVVALLAGLWLWFWSGDVAPIDAAPAHATTPIADREPSSAAAAERREAAPNGTAAATPSASADAAITAAGPTTVLQVLVCGERGEVLPGCLVRAAEHERTTDGKGTAVFELAAGRVAVAVTPAARSDLEPRNGWQTVRAGATTELTMVLSPRAMPSFWCRLVAAEDDRPLSNVEVYVRPVDQRLRSDAQGCVQVASVDRATWLDVRAAGRAPCRIVPAPGHGSRDTALRVPLAAGARLRVRVVDGAQAPVAMLRLTLRAQSWHLQVPREMSAHGPPVEWEATSDIAGRLELVDLPLDVPLDVTMGAPPGHAVPATGQWVLASAHEERTVVLTAGGTIAGRVVGPAGKPVPDVAVAAITAGDGMALPRVFVRADGARTATAAADGTFRFAGLGAGTWWVGIPFGGAQCSAVVAVALPPAGHADVELHADAGLPLAGRALGPDGAGAAGVTVALRLDGVRVGEIDTDAAGRFRFEHLPAGACELRTAPFATDLGLPAPVLAAAGDEGVELRLVPAFGTIAGRVDGGSEAWIMAYRRGSDDAYGTRCDLDGSFTYGGLRAGTWDLAAFDRTGRVARITDVEVLAGRATGGVHGELVASARLRPRHGRADEFVVLDGPRIVAKDPLDPGVPGEAHVPPGTWSVVFRHDGREIARREVTVAAGESRLVDGDR